MNRVLIIALFAFGLFVSVFVFPNGAAAMLVVAALTLPVMEILRRVVDDKNERARLIQIFLIALLVRLFCAAAIYVADAASYFGPDALFYHRVGEALAGYWAGGSGDELAALAYDTSESHGWGMYYLVAAIYSITGSNPLAVQFVSCVAGATTALLVYFCSVNIFANRQAARLAAYAVALFPAFIIWSCQGLKDGLIVFLLVLAVAAIIKLQREPRVLYILVLLFALLGVFTLRFYIFFMVAVAAVGGFLIGSKYSVRTIVARTVGIIFIGLILSYFGILQMSQGQINEYADLERIQRSRQDLSNVESGFGQDLDVSTSSGALAAMPIGFIYLMFSPFPWQMSNIRQSLPLPEMMIWWSAMPFFVSGLLYSVRYRLKEILPILIFILMLTISYSILQGNTGTAYRQRTQIQVFYFMFIAVGVGVWREKAENRRMLRDAAHRRFQDNFLKIK